MEVDYDQDGMLSMDQFRDAMQQTRAGDIVTPGMVDLTYTHVMEVQRAAQDKELALKKGAQISFLREALIKAMGGDSATKALRRVILSKVAKKLSDSRTPIKTSISILSGKVEDTMPKKEFEKEVLGNTLQLSSVLSASMKKVLADGYDKMGDDHVTELHQFLTDLFATESVLRSQGHKIKLFATQEEVDEDEKVRKAAARDKTPERKSSPMKQEKDTGILKKAEDIKWPDYEVNEPRYNTWLTEE
jgi:hypothetical protein